MTSLSLPVSVQTRPLRNQFKMKHSGHVSYMHSNSTLEKKGLANFFFPPRFFIEKQNMCNSYLADEADKRMSVITSPLEILIYLW